MNVQANDQKIMPSHVRVAKTVIAFWLLGWFIKAYFFIPYMFKEVIVYPFVIDFFPAFFRDPLVLQFFYFFPAFAFLVIFRPNHFYFYLAALIMVVSSVILLLHQDVHNDATFLTSFWVAAWLVWFVTQMRRTDVAFLVHARSLALCVIAVIFMGGFVGKLTPEYWNGIVLGDIFMQQNFGWVGEWVRSHYSEGAIRSSFCWISKLVILGEGFLAFAPVWPYRVVYVLGIAFMLGISLFTTWLIFSVLFCLIGLLLAF